jgi:hypothetical protein
LGAEVIRVQSQELIRPFLTGPAGGFAAENGRNQGTAASEHALNVSDDQHVVVDNVVEGVELITARFRFSQGNGIWLMSFIN